MHPSIPLEDMVGNFKFTVLEYHQKALERMVAESTEIKRMLSLQTKTILNSKLEYNRTIIPDISENPISPEELKREEEIDEKVEHLRKERRTKQKRSRVETTDEEEGRKSKRIRIFQEDGSREDIPTIQQERTQTVSEEREACDEGYGALTPVNPGRNGSSELANLNNEQTSSLVNDDFSAKKPKK